MTGASSKFLTPVQNNCSTGQTNPSSSLKSSMVSSESPNNIDGHHFQNNFMFDLNKTDLTDLASDFNQFNDFFKNKSSQLKEIERP